MHSILCVLGVIIAEIIFKIAFAVRYNRIDNINKLIIWNYKER